MPIKGGHHTKEAKEKISRYHSNLPIEKHPCWKGGFPKVNGEYITFKVPEGCKFSCMANKKGYILLHRLIMAEYLQRPLTKEEVVHHINDIKDDNRIENLKLLKDSRNHVNLYHRDNVNGRLIKFKGEVKNG